MERAQSVWTGLEPDLVRSGGLAEEPPALPFLGPAEPPRTVSALVDAMSRRPLRTSNRPDVAAARHRAQQARGRRWGQRAVGMALVLAAALGVAVPIWRLAIGDADDAQLRTYAEWRGNGNAVQFATSSPDRLRNWLAPQLGESLPELPVPTGFVLEGGTIDEREPPARAFVVYRHDGETTLLLVRPQSDQPIAPTTSPVASSHDGLSQLRWTHAGYAYSVVSPLPEHDLLPFTLAEPQPL